MARFSKICIIYNPKSTGNSRNLAKKLQRQLEPKLPDTEIVCIPTEFAGHARELACQIARAEKRPLLISSSGDGGYNEVINGVIDADNPKAVCAVLPAGNANDHSRTMHAQPLATLIVKSRVTHLDLIKVTVRAPDNSRTVRYAHSYVGLGLTPVVAAELNRHTLNAFKEALLVSKVFLKYRPFEILHRHKRLRLDSLLFANINQMAKILTLAPENRPDDGRFEVIMFPSSSKWQLVRRLARAAITRLDTAQRRRVFVFKTIKPMPLQLDGEVMLLKARSEVNVTAVHKALATIV